MRELNTKKCKIVMLQKQMKISQVQEIDNDNYHNK